jgi:hypothetical protein
MRIRVRTTSLDWGDRARFVPQLAAFASRWRLRAPVEQRPEGHTCWRRSRTRGTFCQEPMSSLSYLDLSRKRPQPGRFGAPREPRVHPIQLIDAQSYAQMNVRVRELVARRRTPNRRSGRPGPSRRAARCQAHVGCVLPSQQVWRRMMAPSNLERQW